MNLFGRLYDRVMDWSGRPNARWYLGGLSFAESSFFPIPPDVMLAPMTLARPDDATRLALITTIASVAGGLAGYLIGYVAIDWVEPILVDVGYWDGYLRVKDWFDEWGFWAVLVAGFSPIPYKLFTIAAGTLGMFLPAFIVASTIGRGARFFLVAWLVRWGGPKVQAHLRRNIEWVGWGFVVALVVAYLVMEY